MIYQQRTVLLLLAPLLCSAAASNASDPCKDADDVDACREEVHNVIETFGEAEQEKCQVLDHHVPSKQPGRGNGNPNGNLQSGNGNLGNGHCFTAKDDMSHPCHAHVVWAHDEGRWQHPEWYGQMPHYVVGFSDLTQASYDDFQMYFYCNPYFADKQHNCGSPVCGRSCPEAGEYEWEALMLQVDGEIEDATNQHTADDQYNWCNSDASHSLIQWNEDFSQGQFDCGAVYQKCQENPSGQDCYDVANTFCNDSPTTQYSLHNLCAGADGQGLAHHGYDDTSVVSGGGRRLLRYRIPWWRWALCFAAQGFSIVIFGAGSLHHAARCDLYMTRLVINCLVYFGASPMSALCMAGWMTALTYACQALIAAAAVTVQQYFMWAIRCGPRPNFNPNGRRLMLDLPGNPNHIAYNDVPTLPKFQLPRRLMDDLTIMDRMPKPCGCLGAISEDQTNALVSVVGDGLKPIEHICRAIADAIDATSSACSKIVTRTRCLNVDGCRFDKSTKSCMDVDAEDSTCGVIRHRSQCREESGCVWKDKRCVKGDAEGAVCQDLSKKECKRSDICRWMRKEKMCLEASE